MKRLLAIFLLLSTPAFADAQYKEGDTSSTIRGNAIMLEGTDNTIVVAQADADRALKVRITANDVASGGTSSTDGAAYTAGATVGTPGMGAFDDSAPGLITEGKVGILRMSTNRNLYSTIRDGNGAERGLQVDANGSISVATITTITNAITVGTGSTISVGNTPNVIVNTGSTIKVGNTANVIVESVGTGSTIKVGNTVNTILDSVNTATTIKIGNTPNVIVNTIATNTTIKVGNTINTILDSVNTATTIKIGNTPNVLVGTGSTITVSNTPNVILNNAIPAGTNNIGFVTPTPGTTGGWSASTQSTLSTVQQQVKSGAGTFGGYTFYNPNAAVAYIFMWDSASIANCTNANLKMIMGVPATAAANYEMVHGINAANGIYVASSNTATTITANTIPIIGSVIYK